ncbi:MAG: HXXEE domain-containing protein [Acidobacteriota bacterium]
MNRITEVFVPTAIAIGGIVIFFLVHPLQKFSFAPAMTAALVGYFLTSYRKMPKTERFLPVYLLALAIQFLHFTEEYVYGFHYRVSELMEGIPPFNANTFVAFNMIAYCLFLLAGLGIYKGVKWAMVVVWFFTFTVLGNAVWHSLLAIRVGGYFPGLFTSFAYWIVGPILFMRLWEASESGAEVKDRK